MEDLGPKTSMSFFCTQGIHYQKANHARRSEQDLRSTIGKYFFNAQPPASKNKRTRTPLLNPADIKYETHFYIPLKNI
jgi:hypothetical protein